MTTDRRQRPTTRPLISKISNGDISATGHPIHFKFGSRMEFSGSENRIALFPVRSNPRWRHVGKFQMVLSLQPVIRATSCLILGNLGWSFRGR